MSGLNERIRIPQCPTCNKCYEWLIAPDTWLVPDNVKELRKLKSSLICFRDPEYVDLPGRVKCLYCKSYFNHSTTVYQELIIAFYSFKGKAYIFHFTLDKVKLWKRKE